MAEWTKLLTFKHIRQDVYLILHEEIPWISDRDQEGVPTADEYHPPQKHGHRLLTWLATSYPCHRATVDESS